MHAQKKNKISKSVWQEQRGRPLILKTETTGTLNYLPDKKDEDEKDELLEITYIYNYPQFRMETMYDGEKQTENGTVSVDYKTIDFDGLTFTRK